MKCIIDLDKLNKEERINVLRHLKASLTYEQYIHVINFEEI